MKIFISKEGETPIRGSMGLDLGEAGFASCGGLSAQMLENPDFGAGCSKNGERSFGEEPGGEAGWSPYPPEAKTELKISADRPRCAENPRYLRLTASENGAGAKNSAFGGIFLDKGRKYVVSFHARSYEFKGKIVAGIYRNGVAVFEKKFKGKADGKWHAYSCKFKSKQETEGADFAVRLCGAGTVHLDGFSMLPDHAVKGIFRRDLLERINNFKPDFLQFSVGYTALKDCGGQISTLGIYELFLLCELLGAKALPLLCDGEGECPSSRDNTFDSRLQDALDLAEFACGGAETAWGRIRKELGHSGPFRLEQIGFLTDDKERFDRFAAFVREKCPGIEPVRRTKPADGECGEAGWRATLLDAAALIKAEQTGEGGAKDVPLLARTKDSKDCRYMLGFDGKSVYETADFHVRALFHRCTGNERLKTETENEKIAASATERDGLLFLKIANVTDKPVEAETEGDFDFGSMTRVICVEGAPEAYNSLSEPNKITPYEIAPYSAHSVALPPYSFSVLVFRR